MEVKYMSSELLTLVVNPGSASRKYGLFSGVQKKATIHFEYEDGKIIGHVEFNDQKYTHPYDDVDLSGVSRYVLPLLHEYKVINDGDKLSMIGIRLVAPTMRFTRDELITDEVESVLESVQQKAPLHITTVLSEIKRIKEYFQDIPLVAISDTAFHVDKPDRAWYYGIDIDLAEKTGIKRYGYHGISVSSVIQHLDRRNMLAPKTIVCHIGSGSSVTAVLNGKSIDNTMGYSPLEGLLMASRSGNIDVSAALAFKRELGLTDEGLEEYLNKQSGLFGISGSSNDVRQLIISESQGDKRAKLALEIFVYRLQQSIGQMAASLGGVDCLVFTATIGERSIIMRERILSGLDYLGFNLNKPVNDDTFEPKQIANIAMDNSKPVLVISTDESAEIARRTEYYVSNLQ